MQVVGFGTAVFDQLMTVDNLPKTNGGAMVREGSWQYGGKVGTAIAAVGHMGHSAAMVSPIGGEYGECIKRDFERHGVDTSHLLKREGQNSPWCLCLAELSTGGRSFLGVPTGGGRITGISKDEIDLDFMLQADWLLLEGATEEALYIAKAFKAAGKQVVVDADAYTDALYENMDCYDHFIASEFFYKKVFGDSVDYEANLRKLRERMGNQGVIIVTLGENGMVGIDEEGNFYSHPAFKINVIDTTGAGDIFHGAYIAFRLEGMSAKEASLYASGTSAIACTVLGGRAGLTSIENIKNFVETGVIDYTDINKSIDYYRQCPLLK